MTKIPQDRTLRKCCLMILRQIHSALSLAEISMKILAKVLFFQAVLLLSSNPIPAAQLLSGPMVGHTTPTSARIWVETDEPANVKVDYFQDPTRSYTLSHGAVVERGSASGGTTLDAPYTAAVEIVNLAPRSTVYYEISIDGRIVRPLTPQAFALFPSVESNPDRPDAIADFVIAFGSCNFPSRIPVQTIWAQVVRHRPSAFLFIGDNNYMENTVEGYPNSKETVRYAMTGYHRALRNVAGVRSIMAAIPCYGIWDDHDFGPNNSDRTFVWKKESLRMFRRFWPNPYPESTRSPGVYHKFRISDIEIFMLDDRYHRDPNRAPDRSTMLGAGQLEWLKRSLKSSSATFKVLANGGTLLSEGGKETWHRFGSERDDFLNWMFAEGIEGVFCISGDWHVGTMNRLHRPQDAYPLYELVSSNTAFRYVPVENLSLPSPGRGHQIAAPVIRDYNFGTLRFSGDRGERVVSLQIIDEHGEVRVDRILTEKDLSPRWRD